MNDTVWMVLIAGALIILGVLAYNIHKENQYRKEIREKFGHLNKDALLEGNPASVRDGHNSSAPAAPLPPQPVRETNLADLPLTPAAAAEETAAPEEEEDSGNAAVTAEAPAEQVLQQENGILANTFGFIKKAKPSPRNPRLPPTKNHF